MAEAVHAPGPSGAREGGRRKRSNRGPGGGGRGRQYDPQGSQPAREFSTSFHEGSKAPAALHESPMPTSNARDPWHQPGQDLRDQPPSNGSRNRNKGRRRQGMEGAGRGHGGRGMYDDRTGVNNTGAPLSPDLSPRSKAARPQSAQYNSTSSFEASLNKRGAGAAPDGASKQTKHTSNLRFRDIPNISSPTLAALEQDFGYEFATPVQKDTMTPGLAGQDILARARTGTGKTLGFVIPAMERVYANVSSGHRQGAHIVVVSPTRELASQIAAEANVLWVQLLVGGTSRPAEAKRMAQGPNTVLVCTVGRFHDHAENTDIFRKVLSSVSVVVLDECDRLLEMGFRDEVKKLLKMLPSPESRQTMLFSATLPQQLSTITDLALRKQHVYVDCVGEEAPETAVMVEQKAAVVPKDEWLPRLVQFIAGGTQQPQYKIMVFCTTARTAGFLADISIAMGLPGVSQIHSRMSQPARTKASNAFRNSDGGVIMFTSDVSARGVDYPGTTLVIQVGLPSSRDTYVHRLGRTARAGAKGQGLLLLCDYESRFLYTALKGLPVEDVTQSLPPLPSHGGGVPWFDALQNARDRLDDDGELYTRACQAYVAWMGYMNSNLRMLNWTKAQLVQEASEYAGQLGLSETPIVERKTIGKMGLKGVPGLRFA